MWRTRAKWSALSSIGATKARPELDQIRLDVGNLAQVAIHDRDLGVGRGRGAGLYRGREHLGLVALSSKWL
jgi:hypothetical protein